MFPYQNVEYNSTQGGTFIDAYRQAAFTHVHINPERPCADCMDECAAHSPWRYPPSMFSRGIQVDHPYKCRRCDTEIDAETVTFAKTREELLHTHGTLQKLRNELDDIKDQIFEFLENLRFGCLSFGTVI